MPFVFKLARNWQAETGCRRIPLPSLPCNFVQLFPPPDEVINPVLAVATNLIMGALNLPGEALVERRGMLGGSGMQGNGFATRT